MLEPVKKTKAIRKSKTVDQPTRVLKDQKMPVRRTKSKSVVEIDDALPSVKRPSIPLEYSSGVVREIVKDYVVYRQYINANTRLTNQLKALNRRYGEHLELSYGPLQALSDNAAKLKDEWGKRVGRLAEKLEVWQWAKGVKGFGAVLLGSIIGEAGDLSNYATDARLRKRMGLMPGQRKTKDKERAIDDGYSPERRALMYVVGECLLKLNGEGKYRTIYNERKAYEVKTAEAAGIKVLPSASIGGKVRKGATYAEFRSEGHVHKRAMRYMEQKLLDDLWGEWIRLRGVSKDAAMLHAKVEALKVQDKQGRTE